MKISIGDSPSSNGEVVDRSRKADGRRATRTEACSLLSPKAFRQIITNLCAIQIAHFFFFKKHASKTSLLIVRIDQRLSLLDFSWSTSICAGVPAYSRILLRQCNHLRTIHWCYSVLPARAEEQLCASLHSSDYIMSDFNRTLACSL